MIRKITLSLFTAVLTLGLNAQTTLLNETFSAGIPADWTISDEDGLTPNDDVAEFTNAWIGTIVGEDTVAASTSFYEPTGQAADYLITPLISLGEFSRLIWTARSVDGSFPDGYQVMISTTDNAVGSFTDTLLTIDAETPYSSTRSIVLDLEGYSNQDVYIAFINDTDNGYILLLDEVTILGSEFASVTTENKLTPNVTAYPNPTTDVLNVSSSDQIQEIICLNLSGQEILRSTNTQFSVANFAPGTYILKVRTNNGLEELLFTKK